jgi:histidinol-phosphate/aromatic aminotransferase/cobyric acid decarboxylase-like protein
LNENPFGMSPTANDAMVGAWGEHPHYDPPVIQEITEVSATHVGVKPEHVLVTQGSSEVLSLAAPTTGMQGGEMVLAWPTVKQLPDGATSMGVTVHAVTRTADMHRDVAAMNAKIGAKTCLVVVNEAFPDVVDEPSYRSMTALVTARNRVGRACQPDNDWCRISIGTPDEMKQFVTLVPGAPAERVLCRRLPLCVHRRNPPMRSYVRIAERAAWSRSTSAGPDRCPWL